jgi:uroporphyrinogen decarboxylase
MITVTGKERMEKAFQHLEPDRVPLWEMAFNESSIVGIGAFLTDKVPPVKPVSEMTLEEKQTLLTLLFTIIDELELDGFPSLLLLHSESTGNGFIRDAWGCTFQSSNAGEPVIKGGPIRQPEDLSSFSAYRPKETDFLMLLAAKERFGDTLSQVLVHPGPFQLSRNLVGGMEKFFPLIFRHPGFVHDIMRMTTEYVLESLDMGIAYGADIICLDGDFAYNKSTFISPAHYDKFVKHHHGQIVDFVHSRGKFIFKHSDGNMWLLMDRLVEVGFDGFHSIQPQCMDIGEVKTRYGDKLCLLGNIDCSYLLPYGNESEVEAAVRDTIALAAPGGGFVLCSSNTIHPACKPENYLAMARAALKYGNYPINKGRQVINHG